MKIWVRLFSVAWLAMAGLALTGCLPSGQSQLDEEKEPHYLNGMARENAMDYPGAIESFEKALEANPRSASAHFQLGWLHEQKEEADPSAAIYHYSRYLRLRPDADNAEIVKQRILGSKQELAKGVNLGPVNEKVQKELEQLTEDKKRLTEENKRLADEVARWGTYSSGQSAQSNSVVRVPNGSGPVGLVRTNPVSGGRPVVGGLGRKHIVKAGETPSSIARQYGVRLDALLAANSNLDPRRLKVGQTLNLPPR